MILWLGAYAARRPDVLFGGSATLILDGDNEVQPDGFLFAGRPESGPTINADDYIVGAPQLIVEIAASSASYDLHDKKEMYRQNGVLEYVVWRALDGKIDWFRLVGGAFVAVQPDDRGVIESSAFPGLRLSVPTMLARDAAGILDRT